MKKIHEIFEISEQESKINQLTLNKNTSIRKKSLKKSLIIIFLILDLMAITKPNGYSCEEMRQYYQWEKCDDYVDLFFIALTKEKVSYARPTSGQAFERKEIVRIGAFGIWF